MLRRLKADVGLSVPPKKEVMISAALTSHQQQLYKILLDRASKLRDKAFSNEV
jgi:SNF2 family DNA or RNA helicase